MSYHENLSLFLLNLIGKKIEMLHKFSTTVRKDPSDLTQSTLSLIHVIFRHGHRTPFYGQNYPNDPFRDCQYKPYGQGQLTNEGKKVMYNLGHYIRNQYNDFLGNYFPGCLEARSTAVDRTQCSLQLFLQGLYPPMGSLVWDPSVLWQPIPYICLPCTMDKILQAFKCLEYKTEYKRYQKEIGFKQNHSKLITLLEEHSGGSIETVDDIYLLYFKFRTQEEMGLTLPVWSKEFYPECFEKFALTHYVESVATSTMRRLAIKNFTDKVIRDTWQKLEFDGKVLVHIYSGHELNLAHVLIAFNSFNPPHVPQYGACVILEVHKVCDKAYIKGLYKPDPKRRLEMLHFWNQNPVDFNDFTKLVAENYK